MRLTALLVIRSSAKLGGRDLILLLDERGYRRGLQGLPTEEVFGDCLGTLLREAAIVLIRFMVTRGTISSGTAARAGSEPARMMTPFVAHNYRTYE